MELVDSLMAKVSKTATGCWEWSGCRTRDGYGKIAVVADGKKSTRYTHRLSWELNKGKIPVGMLICHHCDNPPCVNPAHLFIGTKADNADDMVSKFRSYVAFEKVKTRCKRGHVLPVDMKRNVNGSRDCRACSAERNRRYRKNLKEAA